MLSTSFIACTSWSNCSELSANPVTVASTCCPSDVVMVSARSAAVFWGCSVGRTVGGGVAVGAGSSVGVGVDVGKGVAVGKGVGVASGVAVGIGVSVTTCSGVRPGVAV